MNAFAMPYKAYQRDKSATRSLQSMEYEILAEITSELRRFSQDDSTHYPRLVEALQRNRQVWDTFALDVMCDNNPLPSDLKARIVYLSEFIRIESGRILRTRASVDPLIEINMSVMKGLSAQRMHDDRTGT